MATTVDLKVGMNMTIGGLPVSLEAEIDEQEKATVYTFDGCVQDADIALGTFLGYVGEQFGLTSELPPELNISAKIDYIAGQVIHTKPQTGNPTTQMGVSAQFELTADGKTIQFQFYADSILGGGTSQQGGDPYVVGAAIDTHLKFEDLPLVGSIPGFNELELTHLGFSYSNVQPGPGGKPVVFKIPRVAPSPNPLYTRNDPNAKNAQTYAITSNGGGQDFALSSGGFSLTVGLSNVKTGATLNNFALPLSLPQTKPTTLPIPTSYYPHPTSPPASPVHWIKINKTFGPVDLQKIGLSYSQGEATFGFSAGFTLSGFSLDLEGLTITFPMPLPGTPAGSTVSFDLEGLAANFTSGPLTIGGAFLRVLADGVSNYYGEVVAQVSSFGFKALGGYTPAYDGNPASFFLYANISVPLGGPPFLFVTGLAGGFGINRTLILPTLDQLPEYILLPHNAPKQAGTPSETMKTVMPQLETVFRDEPGEYWAAAGIQFTSFEMVQAFGVLTIAFGVDFQIALIGSCAITLPTGDPYPIAYVEVDMMASFSSSSGLFAIQGKLSPASFLYGGFCRLQGGFAFYIWLTGEHQGDFVVTLGGYNPAYTPPAHYPSVPRLGIAFGLGPFHVTGQAYFALTPAMMMAGLTISAVWDTGPIKAWFDTGIDFLLSWAPFYYQAEAYISVGCSVDLGLFTLNAHAGADLVIWGPSFGGKAIVDLDVVTFTIEFGSSEPVSPPVGWNQFKSNFLPQDTGSAPKKIVMCKTAPARRALRAQAPLPADEKEAETTNIIKASVSSGLISSDVTGNNGIIYNWVLDPNQFVIVTNSTIPANNGQWTLATGVEAISNAISDYNSDVKLVDFAKGPYLSLPSGGKTFSATQVWNPTLNIAPMKQNNVQSYHKVILKRHSDGDPSGVYSQVVTEVQVQPLVLDSSAALWAADKPQKSVDDAAMQPGTLVGFQILPIPHDPDKVSNVPLLNLLFAQGFSTGFSYTAAAVDPNYTVSSSTDPTDRALTIQVSGAHGQEMTNRDYVLSALEDPWSAEQRAAVLNDLSANGFSTCTPEQIDLDVLARQTALVDWPMIRLLGDI